MKDIQYYENERDEITSLIDCDEHTKVLDIGCAAGGVGNALKKRGCGEVYGMEIIEGAAEIAKKTYNEVLVGDVETMYIPYENDFFDYIICADVIEHLKDPWTFLKKIKAHLKPNGFIIASIPNIRHRTIISNLLRGIFEYQESGILDNTHLRFFTFDSIVKLFVETGYKCERIWPNIDPNHEQSIEWLNSNNIKQRIQDLVKLLTNVDYNLTNDDLNDLFTIQFIIKVSKNLDE